MPSWHGQAAAPGAESFSLAVWAVLLFAGALYLIMWRQQRRMHRSWPLHRTAFFMLGLALLAWTFSPAQNIQAHTHIQAHMRQHLVSGMYAPLALALGWPLTLMLRSMSVRDARRLVRWSHVFPLHLMASPVGILVLNVGGLYLLYLTPLYDVMLNSALIHAVIAFHAVVAGFVYTAVVAGVEPVAVRAPFRSRLIVLLLGTAGHATLAKVLYAGLWPRGTADSPEELRAAAQLMYYWGDLAEVLLMAVAFRGWFQARGGGRGQRRARHEADRPAQDGAWVRETL